METSKKALVAALAALVLSTATVTVQAASYHMTAMHPGKPGSHARIVVGRFTRLDSPRHTLIVKARAYAFSPKALGGAVKALRPGEMVRITYRAWRGHRTALKIEPVKA